MSNGILRSILRVAVCTALLLLVPYVAMFFTTEVDWNATDFIVAGTMLSVTGLLLEAVMKKGGAYKVPAAIVIVGVFLWLWVELAVGLFTNWGS